MTDSADLVSLSREEADEVAYLLRVAYPTPLRTAILQRLSEALHQGALVADPLDIDCQTCGAPAGRQCDLRAHAEEAGIR